MTLAEKIESVVRETLTRLGVCFDTGRDYDLAIECTLAACRRAANLAIEEAVQVANRYSDPINGPYVALQRRDCNERCAAAGHLAMIIRALKLPEGKTVVAGGCPR